MKIKTTLSATDARKNFFDLIDKVGKIGTPFKITVNGEPKAVLMNSEDFDSWEETLEIMSNPKLVKRIEQGEKDLREGRSITLEELMQKEGLTFVRDKSGQAYDVKRNTK